MSTFIEQLADEILRDHSTKLNEICIVFPTRRAGLFFKKALSARISGPVWSPTIFSIQDFIVHLTGKNIPDNLTLLFRLYETYKVYFPNEDFAKFYPWGSTMLKDFDDIDKYLVDHEKIFSTVKDLHRIEEEFSLAEEDLERLRTFWKNFFGKDSSVLRNEFLNTWKQLQNIYIDYKKNLEATGIAYEGMMYRSCLEDLLKSSKANLEFSHVVFAGFYALTPTESGIIRYFVDNGNATLYWDVDSYYVDDKSQEAGKFLRNNPLIKDDYKWKDEYFRKIPKEFEFAAVPLQVGQAKYAGNILEELMKDKSFINERTAVVLPDEHLLFPVLYSMPEALTDINVTMGYPLRQTPLYNLFEFLIALQKNCKANKSGELSFYYKDILNVINHPYIRIAAEKPIRNWIHNLGTTYIRMSEDIIFNQFSPAFFKEIFQRKTTPQEIFSWFKGILKLILESMKEQDFRFHRMESEFVYMFYTNLQRLEDILNENKIHIDNPELLWRIYREVISALSIPFTGEPLKGLQVMGFLETRVLDFENVIILSVNEDILPSAGNSPSFIPFNIRKAFGLPTFEEQHAVSAYHFYRLLQRAKRIYLVHNSEDAGLTTGERSRFMLQIENELQKRYPESIKISHKTILTRAVKETVKGIVIQKTPAVMKELLRFISDGNSSPGRKFSPSGLSMYIACPLKFYFNYAAGLREIEKTEEDMEAATFGKVFHRAMSLIYGDVIDLNKEVVAGLKKKVDACVDKAIELEYIPLAQLEGKNILLRNVIRELVSKILDGEIKDLPLKIQDLEKEWTQMFQIKSNEFVMLKGIIDRLDDVNGFLRVLDYKTGRVDAKTKFDIPEFFKNPSYKEYFQTMYYSYLVKKLHQDKKIKSGILIARELGSGIRYMNHGDEISPEQFDEFEEHLIKLLNEILSPLQPFTQTTDEKNCLYCAYKSICNR